MRTSASAGGIMHVKSRRLAVWLFAALTLSAACAPADDPLREFAPDEVVSESAGQAAGAVSRVGSEITVRGRVTSISFASRMVGEGFSVVPTRYLLLETSEAHQNLTDGWGLGVELPLPRVRERLWRVAQTGDVIRVRGRLTRLPWDVAMVEKPTLTEVSEYAIEKTAQARPQRAVGEACARDLDCADELWCERRGVCGAIPELNWNSDQANINGTCRGDADCPMGQHCDPGYRTPASGDYSPNYFPERDVGRFLCQVDAAATAETLCPQPAGLADLLGGRYPDGKEVCVQAQIAFPLVAPDRDTHVQGEVPWPLRYPETLPALGPFGAAMENVPMYKDPANPRGVIQDPPIGSRVRVLGTVHFDPSHGWWELHPIRWLRRE